MKDDENRRRLFWLRNLLDDLHVTVQMTPILSSYYLVFVNTFGLIILFRDVFVHTLLVVTGNLTVDR